MEQEEWSTLRCGKLTYLAQDTWNFKNWSPGFNKSVEFQSPFPFHSAITVSKMKSKGG